MDEDKERELFETAPVHKAVAALAIPSIISQIVSIIYNLADTFFIGHIGNPYMVAAVTLIYPWFNILTALGNLFGIGGSSLIYRMLGSGNHKNVKYVSAFSFYGGIAATFLFSLCSLIFRTPLLKILGSSEENFQYASSYLMWVVVLGGIPTMLNMTLAHLLRSEGYAKKASAGIMFGGVLNIILDPILMFGIGMGFIGSAVATAFSNLASALFFLIVFYQLRNKTAMSLSIRNLVGYNYAAKNYKRMRQISVFSWKTALIIAASFVICFLCFAPWIMGAFIQDTQTGILGAEFLRIACLAVPLTAVNVLIIYTLQAMGKGIQSAVLTICRQGFLNIPCLLLMNWLVGLYGMIWTQLIIEAMMLPITLGMYIATSKKLMK